MYSHLADGRARVARTLVYIKDASLHDCFRPHTRMPRDSVHIRRKFRWIAAGAHVLPLSELSGRGFTVSAAQTKRAEVDRASGSDRLGESLLRALLSRLNYAEILSWCRRH